MERSISDLKKTSLQAYTYPTILEMEEMLQGRGKAEEGDP
jgi:hypothetical protein